MGKLDELRQLVAAAFAEATDKTTIENAARINQKIEEVAADNQAMVDKNKELLDAYRDVVLHAPVTTAPKGNDPLQPTPTNDNITSFEGFLNNWLDKQTNK